jgi:hypothetical protein
MRGMYANEKKQGKEKERERERERKKRESLSMSVTHCSTNSTTNNNADRPHDVSDVFKRFCSSSWQVIQRSRFQHASTITPPKIMAINCFFKI